MNEAQFEFAKMNLIVNTPICVADGTKLIAKDYLYDAKTGTLYFVNNSLWHRFIIEHDLYDSYENYIQDTQTKDNLLDWLNSVGFSLDDIRSLVTGHTKVEVNILKPEEKRTANDVFRHIRLADGRIYIPGSSIKGYIRTAVLYHLINQSSGLKATYWEKIKENYRGKPKSLDRVTKELETQFLHKLSLVDNKNRPVKNNNAVCSIMRGLQVSDAVPGQDVTTAVLQKIDIVEGKETKVNKLSVFRECVLPGNKFSFTIKIDKSMFGLVGIKSISQLVDVCREFTMFSQQIFYDCFGRECPEAFGVDNSDIYIGAGTGFLTKTLLYAIAPDRIAATEFIKVMLDQMFRKHKHFRNDVQISPRTLKTTMCNGEKVQMGLASIDLNE